MPALRREQDPGCRAAGRKRKPHAPERSEGERVSISNEVVPSGPEGREPLFWVRWKPGARARPLWG